MPVVPEVETIVRGLQERLTGERIRQCILNRPNMRFAFADDFQEQLENARIESISRRAKYLLFHLDNGYSVIAHLGMSGTMRVLNAEDYEAKKHDHVLWELENAQVFVFHDPRRFGFMLLCETANLGEHTMLGALGPEPLSTAFSSTYLFSALTKRNTAVKVALMDQKLVVGVGNIYASESLFRASISPFMPARDAAKYTKKLVPAIQEVLKEAIASGGSTLRDYVRSDGDSGYFQHAFAVYGRAGAACFVCQQPIEQQRQAGRSTFFCYKCQGVDGV